MNGKPMLYVDQYGQRTIASTVAGLARCYGVAPGTPRRMYRDKLDGRIIHVGYVLGRYWCEAFVPYEGAV